MLTNAEQRCVAALITHKLFKTVKERTIQNIEDTEPMVAVSQFPTAIRRLRINNIVNIIDETLLERQDCQYLQNIFTSELNKIRDQWQIYLEYLVNVERTDFFDCIDDPVQSPSQSKYQTQATKIIKTFDQLKAHTPPRFSEIIYTDTDPYPRSPFALCRFEDLNYYKLK